MSRASNLDQMDSALLYLTTEDSKNTTGAGLFTFNLNSTVFMNHAKRIEPYTVSVPNIFPNVNTYNNKIYLNNVLYTVPEGQYTAANLIAQLNLFIPGDLVWALAADNRITVSWTAVGDVGFSLGSLTTEFCDLLGFSASQLFSQNLTLAGSPITAAYPPNLGGRKLIFIQSDGLARSNIVHGRDGKVYDTFACVSLSDVGYGDTATLKMGDFGDVQFRTGVGLQQVSFELLDERFRPISLPPNFHVRMVLKVYHRDTQP